MTLQFFEPSSQRTVSWGGIESVPGVLCCPGWLIIKMPGKVLHDPNLLLPGIASGKPEPVTIEVRDGQEAICEHCGTVYSIPQIEFMRDKRI